MAAILKELEQQKLFESYSDQRNHWSFLAATIINSTRSLAGMFSKRKPKMVSPDDLIDKNFKKAFNDMFKKENEFDKHIQDAKAKGLKGPWGGEGN